MIEPAMEAMAMVVLVMIGVMAVPVVIGAMFGLSGVLDVLH